MNDIYSAPTSTLTETTVPGEHGSIERGIAGDYKFSVGETFSEAWAKTKGAKGTINLAVTLYIVIIGIVSVVLGFVLTITGFLGGAEPSLSAIIGKQALTQIVTTAISLPMAGGLFIIGLRRSVNAIIGAGGVLQYFNKAIPLLAMVVLMYILITIGLVLLVIPGIYLTVSYYLAIPLMLEKNLGPWQALETSRKAISKRWFAVLGFFLLLALINIATVFTLFIGTIWTIPMSVIAYGIFYRNIFGIEADTLTR